ncbi:MAG: ABC transporter ATP-binding protein [Phycisphaeraceae bacterium]|nr:ABC transporter ATP-binding protein [Phycisphaeraceae bacterium]
MISCTNVRKSYQIGNGRVEALRGVDMRINEPGFYAIMGRSGSGKSTLLHLLAALDKPDEGEILISGQRIDSLSEQEATLFRRTKIGIVFQQFNLIPTMTAVENAELPAILAGATPESARARAAQLLTRLGLSDRLDHRPDALSGGEQQRVAIARALHFSPGLLLADEPTGNLDSVSSESLWNLLSEIAREQSISIVMVTHEPAAAAHCREIFVVADGRVTDRISTEGLDESAVAARYQQSVATA